ncbi:MAG: YraN family protein [Candidatus Accumulibacter sp.]|nr:YraN family protein [Accumulibacter sp.]
MNGNDTTARAGQEAENLAARFLERRGLAVIARNHRCRGGEVDLICRDGGTLVFVEVRLRRGGGFGGAAASITPAKQRRVALAARHYLATTGRHGPDCRFDCVLLDGKNVEWIRDAFSAQ